MQQVFVYVMSVPMLEREGIKFVGFVKKVDENRFTELLFPPVELQEHPSVQILASPNGNIYGMNEACFRYLGLPKYICDDSDHRLSDSNVSKLIRNHRAVLFECLKNCPTGQEAMISNESFKNVIIPDRHSHSDMKHIRSCFGKYQAIVQAQPMDFGY